MRIKGCVLTLVAFGAASVLFAAPRLAYPPGGIDLGEIPAGEPARGGCTLVNAGDATLKVSQVKPC